MGNLFKEDLHFNLLEIFRFIGPNLRGITALPIASNEMFLAVWLMVKGFNSSAIASGPAKTDINEIK